MRVDVLLNPGARDGDAHQAVRAALAELSEARLVMVEPEGIAEAARAAHDAGAVVVAAGGDGTVHAVVNALEERLDRARVGILPLGTGNDLVRTLGIPAALAEAVAVLRGGIGRRIDLLELASDAAPRCLCVNVAAGGFAGEVHDKLTPEVKERWGPLAYVRSGLAVLPERSEHRVWLRFEEGLRVQDRALNLAFANGAYVAGGIPVAPGAALDDGLVDVVLFEAMSLPQIVRLTPTVLRGRHLDPDSLWVKHFRSAAVRLRASPPMPFNADGELLGRVSRLAVRVLPRALEVIVPAP
jgi:diacylglycerol kinase (ATP)